MAGLGGLTSLFGLATSLIGGLSGGNTSTVSGGLSPQEAALAEYGVMQKEMANAAKFGAEGMGHSTGLTFADAGAQIGGATQAAKISDANAQASNQLAQLAQQSQQQAGLNTFGNTGGNFGNTGGNTGGNVNQTPDVSSG